MDTLHMGVNVPEWLAHAVVLAGFAATFILGYMCGRETRP
jgi:hypothetical protein